GRARRAAPRQAARAPARALGAIAPHRARDDAQGADRTRLIDHSTRWDTARGRVAKDRSLIERCEAFRVKNHVSAILQNLYVRDRTRAVLMALEQRLV